MSDERTTPITSGDGSRFGDTPLSFETVSYTHLTLPTKRIV